MLSSCISSHVNDTINRTMEFSRRRSRRRNCLAQLIGRVVIKGARCLILASYVKKSGRTKSRNFDLNHAGNECDE